MTTIAMNRRCMAADRKVCDGGTFYYTKKIFVIEKSIIGLCGDVGRTNKFLAWMKLGQPKDTGTVLDGEDPNFQALVLNRNGMFLYADIAEPDEILDTFYATGTGSGAALAVMHRPIGYSPSRAVSQAAKVDPNTGGKIDVLWVRDL
jgi:hypothetical protein